MTTIKYDAGKERCPKCNGLVSYNGSATQKLPLGLGFAPGSGKFQIDFAVRKGFAGECMDCGLEIFAVKSTSHQTKYPRSINRKLSALAA